MLSTFTTYRLQSQDFTRTMTRVAAEPQPSHDAAYFKANIGNVKTVDDFLKNPRLFNFAMQAYGLQDMAFGTAFMRKVLTSDLADTASFANRLSDKRYVQFARAFNFSTSTTGANVVDIQDDTQAKDTLTLYSAHETRIANTAASETGYFKSRISSITSVDGLLSDTRLRNYVLTAVGLDQATSNSLIKQVLSGDTSAIPAGASAAALHSWQDLAKAFSFQADGTAAAGSAQTSSQQTMLTGFYAMQVNGGVTQHRLRHIGCRPRVRSAPQQLRADGLRPRSEHRLQRYADEDPRERQERSQQLCQYQRRQWIQVTRAGLQLQRRRHAANRYVATDRDAAEQCHQRLPIEL